MYAAQSYKTSVKIIRFSKGLPEVQCAAEKEHVMKEVGVDWVFINRIGGATTFNSTEKEKQLEELALLPLSLNTG